MKWSLKTRLTIWMTLVMSICIMAGFAWIHFGLKSILNSKNEVFLTNKADELLAALKDDDSGGLEALESEIKREAETYESDGLILILHKLSKLEVVPDLPANFELAKHLESIPLSSSIKPVPIQLGGQDFMYYRITIDESYYLDLILSLQDTRLILAQFDRRALLGGLTFLAVAMAGGYYFTIQALRPVAASIQTARTLKPDQMATRLPLSGTGDEIDELATTINGLLDRLSAYHAQIIRFTADASHELRGPMGAIRAIVEVALQKPRSQSEYQDILETLGEQCDKLTLLVDALLLLARADAGQVRLNLKPVDFKSVASEIFELYQPLAEENYVDLQLNACQPYILKADEQRLRQLVSNLVDNAIKFNRPGGIVSIALKSDQRNLELIVEDDGIGVSDEQINMIFNRFYQADSARSFKGSGLGLSICQWICDAHGGSIHAERKIPSGMRVTAKIPVI
jgi:signal transduction histidine kinase